MTLERLDSVTDCRLSVGIPTSSWSMSTYMASVFVEDIALTPTVNSEVPCWSARVACYDDETFCNRCCVFRIVVVVGQLSNAEIMRLVVLEPRYQMKLGQRS